MPLVARLLLAAVFAFAAAAKLRDRRGARQAITSFGVPSAAAGPVAVALPFVELTTALLLVVPRTATAGILAAAMLLAIFTLAVVTNLLRGRRPECHCFGQIASGPIGWTTVGRNVVLLIIALLGFEEAPLIPASVPLPDPGVVLAFAAVLAVELFIALNLVRQNGRLLVRLDVLEQRVAAVAPMAAPSRGLPISVPAPSFQLQGVHGETLTLEALRAANTPVLLTFVDPQCGPCNALLPDLGRWQTEHSSKLTIALVSRGTPDENRMKSSEHGIRTVLLQRDREVAEAYLVTGTPSATLVSPDGRIGSVLAEGADAIAALVAQATGTATPTAASHQCGGAVVNPGAVRLGEPVPPLRIPDLNGAIRNLANVRTPTAVVFWNPSCGFCQQMLAELQAWERERAQDAPQLIVISTGSAEANRALELRSTIVLDQDSTAMRAFGVSGTPSAVLVDAGGKVSSLVAVGAPGVMSLLAPSRPALTS